MQNYLPEGMYCDVKKHADPIKELTESISTHKILQATATKCDEEHNLTVDLGANLTGIIPKNETAMGIKEGTTREIAILTRVGRPVCFRTEASCGDGVFRLSRKSAQQDALRHLLQTCTPGDILPAVVTGIAPFGAFCDIGCGVTALLGLEAISISRAPHPSCRFRIGQRIFVVIQSIDRTCGRITLSHRELLGTWEENAAKFQPGQTVTGIVRTIRDYGAFIELTPNLSGLCDPDPRLHEGDAVSVYIKSILPERVKIKLVPISVLPPQQIPPIAYTRTEGRIDFWQYGPEGLPKTQSVFLTSSQ